MKHINQASSFHRAILLMSVFGFIALFQINCAGVIASLEQYSGETLYDTAVESNGDLLSFAPDIQAEIDNHLETDKERREFQAFQRELITKLIKENPDFVEDFKEKLHSNDREQINEALSDAGALVEAELQSLTGKNNVTAENVVNAVLEKNE